MVKFLKEKLNSFGDIHELNKVLFTTQDFSKIFALNFNFTFLKNFSYFFKFKLKLY